MTWQRGGAVVRSYMIGKERLVIFLRAGDLMGDINLSSYPSLPFHPHSHSHHVETSRVNPKSIFSRSHHNLCRNVSFTTSRDAQTRYLFIWAVIEPFTDSAQSAPIPQPHQHHQAASKVGLSSLLLSLPFPTTLSPQLRRLRLLNQTRTRRRGSD